MEQILKYFPNLSEQQISHFEKLDDLYQDWNSKINVVSRKDVELLYERHVLHSLAIAKIIKFKPQAQIMDLGTGGGFPGIPLAIMFPETSFYLVDSIAKKIKVVQEVTDGIGLKNVRAEQVRAEKIQDKFDFVISRAVAPLRTLMYWTKGKYEKMWNHEIKNGLICLKGGDLTEEIKESSAKSCAEWDLKNYFKEEFFETKKIIYVPMI